MYQESEVINMKFCDVLKKLRNSYNLSQGQLADKLNISKSTISMYELGNRSPDMEMLRQIADFFNVDINYLFGIITKPDLTLTPHETKVMTAYRDQPEMQPAVDRILGITEDGYVTVYAAANSASNHKHTITRIPQEKWAEIENEPNTDEDLM